MLVCLWGVVVIVGVQRQGLSASITAVGLWTSGTLVFGCRLRLHECRVFCP